MVVLIITAVVCTDMSTGDYAVCLMAIEFNELPSDEKLWDAVLEYTAPIGELLDYDVVDVEVE